ncbi:MAG TPA: protein kinase, partial [Candidatus Sulfopaludibacter sp.]|nr:protein kinase [Candidatus Sulfopaludibacter sp.]
MVEFEHSINAAIKALRQALGDDANNPRFVETLPRRGYRFIAPVDGVVVAAVHDRRPVNETEKAAVVAAVSPPAVVAAGGIPQPEDGAHRAPLQQDAGARYRLLEKLGAGGMGEVWRARDTKLNRDVALKFLSEDFASDHAALERFKREAQLASALNHPHICSIYDTGELDGRQFISMELVEGETLAARLAGTGHVAAHAVIPAQAGIQHAPAVDPRLREGDDKRRTALQLDTILEYGIEIAGALAAAHRLGIIHRDLKPQNIMLTKSGTKLLDFGLAKSVAPVSPPANYRAAGGDTGATKAESLTAQGAIMGTLHYMAPEQLEGKPADARSDIFAFGCVLYEMATGRRAFEGDSSAQVMAAIMQNDPAPITNVGPNGVRPLGQRNAPNPAGGERRSPLQRVVMKCLAKDPEERWQTATDLRDELKWIKEGEVVAADYVRRTDEKIGDHRAPLQRALPWAIAVAAAIAAVVLGIVAAHYMLQPKAEESAIRFSISPPENTSFGHYTGGIYSGGFSLSPDGHRLAFLTGTLNPWVGTQLW